MSLCLVFIELVGEMLASVCGTAMKAECKHLTVLERLD